MSVGFLITSPYQLFHYKQIAAHLDDVTALCEIRESDLGLDEELVAAALPNARLEWVHESKLSTMDGRFGVVVCQTPILPLRFFTRTLVVAQQYSLAKERYQYGIWRAQADLNLMYGPSATARVSGFARAVAVGNPLLDPYWQLGYGKRRVRTGAGRPRLLYAPTYGSLSSLREVMPRLYDADVDITVKLHHAEDPELARTLRDEVEVVYSDADPAELFRDHDGVLSDVSGVVYDALYAGLPAVLVDAGEGTETDRARLSESERGDAALAAVTQVWEPGTELAEALRRAQAKQETTVYTSFITDTFVNPGTAGVAAAEQIKRLLADGPSPHFAADQVRHTVRRYIQSNRQLRTKPGESTESAPDAAAVRGAEGSRERLYRQARTRLARVEPLRRAVKRARRLRRHYQGRPVNLPVGDLTEPRPAHRRENVWRQLEPLLAEAGLRVGRDSDRTGAMVGVREEDKRRLWRVLRRAAKAHPKLFVRLGSGQRSGPLHRLSELAEWELHAADWLEVGELTATAPFERDPSGYLTVEFAAYNAERNRYLASRTVSTHPDWTTLLSPDRASAGPVTVAATTPHAAGPIDIVYTWVDSRDPAWQAARDRYAGTADGIVSSSNEERYLDREELKHSLRSVWMFAPFVRNIFIVTADQHPAWLSTMDPRVKVVTHRELFPDPSVLPTFNSHAIESCLHRVPGLSENFLYFNDDVFLGREVTEDDFFTTCGHAKVRLSPSQFIYDGEPEPDAIPTDWAAYNSTGLIARDFGRHFAHRVKHVPLALNTRVLTEIEERYPAEVDRTRAARFRSRADLALPSMFGQYYAIVTGRAVEWPDAKHQYVYLDTGKHAGLDRFRWITDWRPMFYCLNATRFTEVDLAVQDDKLRRFYRRVLPHPAPWEVDPIGAAPVRRLDDRQPVTEAVDWGINPAPVAESVDTTALDDLAPPGVASERAN